jgi:thioredoxin 1
MNIRGTALAIVLITSATVIAGCRTTPSSPEAMLDRAAGKAREAHQVLMVEFGADWCSDCSALAKELQEGPVHPFFRDHVALFKVDVGEFNRNLGIARSLGVDVNQGIPAAVFLSPDGLRVRKQGVDQILAFLRSHAEAER